MHRCRLARGDGLSSPVCRDGGLGFPFDIAAAATVRDDEDAVGELEVERPIEHSGVCYAQIVDAVAQIMRVGQISYEADFVELIEPEYTLVADDGR